MKRTAGNDVNGSHTGSADAGDLVSAVLEEPVPVVGHHSQHLGVIHRSLVQLGDGRIEQWELQTQWQKIVLGPGEVEYDDSEEVFRLKKRRTQ